MEENLDNANPTILDASDLPSRHREITIKQRQDGSIGLFDAFLPAYAYPYNNTEVPCSPEDSSDDEDVTEEIDAQEIYGSLHPQRKTHTKWRHTHTHTQQQQQ